MKRSVYRITTRKRLARNESGRFKARYTDPQLIEIEPSANHAEELANAVSDVIRQQYSSPTSPIDRVEIELIGTLT